MKWEFINFLKVGCLFFLIMIVIYDEYIIDLFVNFLNGVFICIKLILYEFLYCYELFVFIFFVFFII